MTVANRPAEREPRNCRLAVFDDITGELLGYKADTHWTLCEEVYKKHLRSDTSSGGILIRNLLCVLKDPSCEYSNRRLRVAVERISDSEERSNPWGGKSRNTTVEEVLSEYTIFQGDSGEYEARERT